MISGAAGFSLVAAIASEGDATLDIVGFAVGTADTAGQLRASRNGGGNGRIDQLESRMKGATSGGTRPPVPQPSQCRTTGGDRAMRNQSTGMYAEGR